MPASPIVEVKDGAGAYQATTTGVDVTPGNTVTIRLVSQADVDVWLPECISTDELGNKTTINASLVIDSVQKTATFTAPVAGRALRFQSRVVGRDGKGYATTFGIYTRINARRVHALDEMLESGPFGWGPDINDVIRNPSPGGGGGGTVPTGTGFTKIVAGVQQAAAEPVDLADATERTGILPVGNGGTGATTHTSGNILKGAGAGAITSFAPGAGVETFLTTPSGANLAAALTSALPVTKGGTGATTFTAARLIYGNGAGALAETGAGIATDGSKLSLNAVIEWGTGTMPGGGYNKVNEAIGTWLSVRISDGGGRQADVIHVGMNELSIGGDNTGGALFPTTNIYGSSIEFWGGGIGPTAKFGNAASDFVGLGGGTYATVGFLRFAAGAQTLVASRIAAGTSDLSLLSKDVSDYLYLGTDTAYTSSKQVTGISAYCTAGGNIALGVGSLTYLYLLGGDIECWQPICGTSVGSTPFRFKKASITQSNTTDTTLTAAQYECPVLEVTGTPGGNFNLIAPNTADGRFEVTNKTANTLTIKKSGGTGVAIATNKSAIVRHDGTDYIRITADA